MTRPREARQSCGGGVEHSGLRGELRDDRHGHDEQQDRPHAVADLQRGIQREDSEDDGCAAQEQQHRSDHGKHHGIHHGPSSTSPGRR
jgi:hypothetical protein